MIDCHLYHQPDRLILNLVNLTSAGTWRQPLHELILVGPLQVRIKGPANVRGRRARLLISGKAVNVGISAGWRRFEVQTLLDHEVIIIA